MKQLFTLLLSLVLLAACQKENFETKTLMIADHQVDCVGEAPQQCLLIKENESDNWQFFYGGIEGFDYEAGFEYRLEVKVYDVKNPPADGSSKRYVLKRIINKQ